MEETTRVVFRLFEGEVIALFPDLYEGRGRCLSYMHVGQHAPALYKSVVARSMLAKPEEYASLKQELEEAPYRYKLRVVKRA